jgi:hypothetical protein
MSYYCVVYQQPNRDSVAVGEDVRIQSDAGTDGGQKNGILREFREASMEECIIMLVDVHSGDLNSLLSEREVNFLESLWARYAPYADTNFHTEFQNKNNLQSRFFEMYLTVALLEQSFPVVRRAERTGDEGPDICIEDPCGRVWIEAVAPTRGNGRDAVGELIADGQESRDKESRDRHP